MKLFTYQSRRGVRTGAVLSESGQGIDLNDVELLRTGNESAALASLQQLIEEGDPALQSVRENLAFATRNPDKIATIDLNKITYLSPIPQPVKLVCFSVYEKHMIQAINALVEALYGKFGLIFNRIFKRLKISPSFYTKPFYYKGNITSFIGHRMSVQWPSFEEDRMDYELELAVIIGKKGKDIKPEKASAYIWGYSIFDDFSARSRLIEEITKGQGGPLKGKDFHTGNALGPWIVTADEIDDPQNLEMKVYVNDELRGEANTAEMYHSIPQLIAAASEGEYILPGEVIATGAAGDGTGIEQWRFLEPEDRVRLEIEGIGALENTLLRQTSQVPGSENKFA